MNSLAGYAFARLDFKGKHVLFIMVLATMMIPFQVIMVPLFLEVYKMGMYDNFAGLIIPNLGAAMTVFMTRASFAGLPKELEEAARIDGLSEFGIFWKIMLPLVKPTVVTVIVLGINGAWNDLMWPLIVTSNTSMRTLTMAWPCLSIPAFSMELRLQVHLFQSVRCWCCTFSGSGIL